MFIINILVWDYKHLKVFLPSRFYVRQYFVVIFVCCCIRLKGSGEFFSFLIKLCILFFGFYAQSVVRIFFSDFPFWSTTYSICFFLLFFIFGSIWPCSLLKAFSSCSIFKFYHLHSTLLRRWFLWQLIIYRAAPVS